MSIKITFIAFTILLIAAGLIPDQKPFNEGVGIREQQMQQVTGQQ